jgi:ribosomal-protein-alanine N-acetyltransferase
MAFSVNTLDALESVRGVLNVHDTVWGKSFGIVDLFKNSTRCFVLQEDGQVCGYAFVEEDKARGFFELQDIAVLPDKQGGGRGQALMRAVLDYCARIKLICRDKNTPLVKFYEKHGFATEMVVENYYDVGEDGRRMYWPKTGFVTR